MIRLILALALMGCVGCCWRKPAPCPTVSVPPEPVLETAALPETASPEQTQEAQTRDLVRWIGHARQLRELLRPYEAPKPTEKR